MTQPPTSDPGAPTALAAFLRGIERRGAVFADLQSGDPAVADLAYAQALRGFRDAATAHAFAAWPRLFWRALLAAPPLRSGTQAAHWPPPFAALAACGSGPRAALLLRLVAGLTDADAADVLGIAPATYRLALQQALPRREDGTPDPDTWRALDAAVQEAQRLLPAERLAHLARLRQAAAQGRRPDLIGPMPAPAVVELPAEPRQGRVLRGALWAGVALCALAFAASFLPWNWPAGTGGDPQVRITPLPPAQTPAARYDRAAALLTEPDFELLAQSEAQPVSDDAGFYAWAAQARAGGGDGAADPDAGMRDPMPPEAQTTGEPESVDAPF